MLRQTGELLGGLAGEFPGGGEDKDLGLPIPHIDLLDRRDAERCCLPGPGLCLTGDVASFEYHGYCAYLNWCGLLKAHILYRLKRLLRDIEILEGNVILHSPTSWC